MNRHYAITLGAFGMAIVVAAAMVLLALLAPKPPVSNPTIVFTNTKHEPVTQPPVTSKAAQEGKQP